MFNSNDTLENNILIVTLTHYRHTIILEWVEMEKRRIVDIYKLTQHKCMTKTLINIAL